MGNQLYVIKSLYTTDELPCSFFNRRKRRNPQENLSKMDQFQTCNGKPIYGMSVYRPWTLAFLLVIYNWIISGRLSFCGLDRRRMAAKL